MVRVTDTRSAPRNWSGPSTVILLTFIVIGILQAGAHDPRGAVVCFLLAAVYPPLRILRGRLTSSRNR
jgi:hypothetical protein